MLNEPPRGHRLQQLQYELENRRLDLADLGSSPTDLPDQYYQVELLNLAAELGRESARSALSGLHETVRSLARNVLHPPTDNRWRENHRDLLTDEIKGSLAPVNLEPWSLEQARNLWPAEEFISVVEDLNDWAQSVSAMVEGANAELLRFQDVADRVAQIATNGEQLTNEDFVQSVEMAIAPLKNDPYVHDDELHNSRIHALRGQVEVAASHLLVRQMTNEVATRKAELTAAISPELTPWLFEGDHDLEFVMPGVQAGKPTEAEIIAFDAILGIRNRHRVSAKRSAFGISATDAIALRPTEFEDRWDEIAAFFANDWPEQALKKALAPTPPSVSMPQVAESRASGPAFQQL